MKNTAMGRKEYVILFVVSIVVFYTVLGLLGPFVGLPGASQPITAGVVGSGSSGCSGDVIVSFFPDTVDVGTRASAIITGIQNCNSKVVFVREQVGTDFVLKCSCVVQTGNGCGCSFPVGSSACSSPTFYAQIDMNGNGDYNDAGETSVAQMNLNGCMV
jgi:hypothetical protein